jgi:menaquinone-dependent protoporphyrinogen IX oxidase
MVLLESEAEVTMANQPRILVTYTTNAGSTKEVAERVAGSIPPAAGEVTVLPVESVEDITRYRGVVLGGPMIMGWHRKTRRFYKKHRRILAEVPVHVFMTAMRVTDTGETGDVTVDPGILVPAANPHKISVKEKFTTRDHYVAPVVGKGSADKPDSIAIFGGKLDYTKLRLFQMLFVMLVVGEAPGDKRNWKFIEQWASSLQFS